MPRYPLKPALLVDTADRLAPREIGRGRPAYSDHRRAVSTAYYAVFHAINDRVAKASFTEADDAFLRRIERWIGHGDIKEVAVWICQLEGQRGGKAPAHISSLLRPGGTNHIDEDSLVIAEGFLELNEKREQADYDHDAIFTRADTLIQIDLARAVVERVETTQSNEAKRLFGLIGMRARIQSR